MDRVSFHQSSGGPLRNHHRHRIVPLEAIRLDWRSGKPFDPLEVRAHFSEFLPRSWTQDNTRDCAKPIKTPLRDFPSGSLSPPPTGRLRGVGTRARTRRKFPARFVPLRGRRCVPLRETNYRPVWPDTQAIHPPPFSFRCGIPPTADNGMRGGACGLRGLPFGR